MESTQRNEKAGTVLDREKGVRKCTPAKAYWNIIVPHHLYIM